MWETTQPRPGVEDGWGGKRRWIFPRVGGVVWSGCDLPSDRMRYTLDVLIDQDDVPVRVGDHQGGRPGS